MLTTNVEVTRSGSESSASLIRRFTKRVQGAGILRRVRGLRYFKRDRSKYFRKQMALKTIIRREQYEELAKQGKLPEPKTRGRHH